jgi:hypothetical protein
MISDFLGRQLRDRLLDGRPWVTSDLEQASDVREAWRPIVDGGASRCT